MGERTPIEEAEHRAACCVLYESRMRSEARRLRTFYEWPSTSPVSALDLVKAGFFFVGPRDAVQCFCCGVVLDSWESGDCPIVEHKKYLPSCRFVCGEDVGNQEMHSHQETFDTVDGQLLSLLQGVDTGTTSLLRLSEYPEMGTEEMRLSTFQNWPQYAGTNPERLARAGFFYTGIGDLVRCFHCGGGLTNWSIGDDPWMEHASLFPDCEFLLRSRGREFVSSIQESFSNTQLSQRDSWDQTDQDSSASQDADLRETETSSSREDVQTVQPKESDESRMSTEEQLRRLQQERMCKVCMDRDVSVVFVPCGHLVACGECAVNLRLCPICRAIIRESVRTFMS